MNRGINSITAVCMTNTAYSGFSDSVMMHGGLSRISFSPEGLNSVKNEFFDFIFPDILKDRKETMFDEYSYNLRKCKGVGQFQQLCDLYYCAFVCESNQAAKYAILGKDSYVLKASNFFDLYEDFISDNLIQEEKCYQERIK